MSFQETLMNFHKIRTYVLFKYFSEYDFLSIYIYTYIDIEI